MIRDNVEFYGIKKENDLELKNIILSEFAEQESINVLDLSKKLMEDFFFDRPHLNHKYNYWLKNVEQRGNLL